MRIKALILSQAAAVILLIYANLLFTGNLHIAVASKLFNIDQRTKKLIPIMTHNMKIYVLYDTISLV